MSGNNTNRGGIIRIEANDSINLNDLVKPKKNTVLYGTASKIMEALFSDTGASLNGAKTIKIYDSTDTLVKTLVGSWGDVIDGGTYLKRTLSVEDDSTDEYEIASIYLEMDDESAQLLRHIEDPPQTKGSDQIMNLTWEVIINYGT